MNFEEYERNGLSAYAALATTVAAILTAAISAEGDSYRLQQVKARAKQPASLRRKLEQRSLGDTTTLEAEIKDLAGCRIIFYTNNDVTRFINSGIVQQNFDMLDVKIHHPRRDIEDATELYTSNHYLVTLSQARLALPEYAHFAGMRCEIQIQTILHHAWAEMAHDTIYKAPELANFGGKAFESIKGRMQKVAQKYLVPAGYEFQRIAIDFQRLLDGKALFDGDALEAIVDAPDNNTRVEALEKFAESVLPFYDDLKTIYPEVVARLLEAVDRARAALPVTIETPYGEIPAKTAIDVINVVVKILKHYRYLDVNSTFDALCRLFAQTASNEEAKGLLELGKALAKHQLDVWRQYGPVVQGVLLERIEAISEEQRAILQPLLTPMLAEVLGTEIKGTTASSSAVTFHQGPVVASDELRKIRTQAIDLLKRLFILVRTDAERRAVLQALEAGTRQPYRGIYSNALLRLVMDDTRTLIEFQTEMVPSLGLELLRSTEVWVHRCYWNNADLPEGMRDDPELATAREQLEAAAMNFRDVVNALDDFVTYKTLVGYDSVLAPAWQNEAFRYAEPTEFRTKQIDGLVASVDETNADLWFDRICRYAHTESDDLATFSEFANFLERVAETKPAIVLRYTVRIEGPLTRFLPRILAGLMRSAQRADALVQINAWLNTGVHLGAIAWYLQLADPFDEIVLQSTLGSAIQHEDGVAVRCALVAAASQFADHPGTLVDTIFLPALRYLDASGDYSWLHLPLQTWFRSPIIRALDEEQAEVVLATLVRYPNLQYSAENVVAAIAEQWPANVVTFLGARQAFSRTDNAPRNYDAVPYAVHELKDPLAAAPDLMLKAARAWYEDAPHLFIYDGGRLLASVFPDISGGLKEQLETLLDGGNEQDLVFVLAVLSAFWGQPCIYDLVRQVVAVVAPDSPLLQQVQFALRQTGVVCGEFGFAELHAERKAMLESWCNDPSEQVQAFAAREIHFLDQLIAAEHQSAETSIALRKLQYGEELDSNVKD